MYEFNNLRLIRLQLIRLTFLKLALNSFNFSQSIYQVLSKAITKRLLCKLTCTYVRLVNLTRRNFEDLFHFFNSVCVAECFFRLSATGALTLYFIFPHETRPLRHLSQIEFGCIAPYSLKPIYSDCLEAVRSNDAQIPFGQDLFLKRVFSFT